MTISASHDVTTFALDAQEEYDTSEPLFIDALEPRRSLSSVQVSQLVHTLIAGFKALGLQRGDCVLVNAGNNVLYTALFLAVIGTGCVHMGSNPHSSVEELDRVFELSKPRLIIAEEAAALRNVLDVSNRRNIPANRVLLLDETAISATIALIHGQPPIPAPSTQSPHDFLSLLAHGTSDHERVPSLELAKDTPAALYLTSGTTGLPKAAVLSHAALLARHRAIAHTPTPPYAVKRLICLPIFHVFSSLWTHLFPVRYGHPLYILRGFQLPMFLDTIRRYRITETYLVPVVIQALNQAPASLEVNASLESLRYVGISGAPIDRASMEVFQGLLHPDACAGQVWGMTECGVVIQSRFPVCDRGGREGQDDLGGIGRVLPGYEVKLDTTADEYSEGQASSGYSQREVIEGEEVPGQLYVRGPGLLSGYLGQREPVVDSQGWFNTGDVAYFNSRREYFIIGRTKELIKVQGYQVAPAEIEAVLIKHPLITDIAVMGITLPSSGTEAPRAYVVRAGAASRRLTADEVYGYVQDRLAGYKALDGGVFFVDSIPRTANGKIQRGKLERMNGQREILATLLRGPI